MDVNLFRKEYPHNPGQQVHHPAVPHLPGPAAPAHADGALPGWGPVDPPQPVQVLPRQDCKVLHRVCGGGS